MRRGWSWIWVGWRRRYGRSSRSDETLQKFDLVESGLSITRGRFYDFESYMTVQSKGGKSERGVNKLNKTDF
jgi:hypothetical protein